MKIIVAGSRAFGSHADHRKILYDRLDLALSRRAEAEDEVVVISGTARGADQMGEEWAASRGCEVIRMPAQWDKYGKSAGPKRNEEMAAVADAAIIFWDGISRGSMNMRDICHRLNIPVNVVRFSGSTRVVNIKTCDYDVYIGRAGNGEDGYFGNPFRLRPGEPRGSTIAKYREYFYDRLESDSEFRTRILALKGKRLGCFCKPNSCHGDVIAEWLND